MESEDPDFLRSAEITCRPHSGRTIRRTIVVIAELLAFASAARHPSDGPARTRTRANARQRRPTVAAACRLTSHDGGSGTMRRMHIGGACTASRPRAANLTII
jgi:hypothetical protein